MTPDEIKKVVKHIIEESRMEVGVASETDEQKVQLQQDFAWLRRQREATADIAKWIRRGVITTVLSGVLYLLWEGLKLALRQ